MKTLINQSELALLLDNVLIGCYAGYRSRTFTAMRIQAVTGLRIREVLEPKRWTNLSPNVFRIDTEKGSYDRIIDFNYSGFDMQTLFDAGWNTWAYFSPNPYQHAFKEYSPFSVIKVREKHMSTHLFRYMYARNIYSIRESYEDVQEALGLVNPATAIGYVEFPIYGYD
jgi:hypothetical protein